MKQTYESWKHSQVLQYPHLSPPLEENPLLVDCQEWGCREHQKNEKWFATYETPTLDSHGWQLLPAALPMHLSSGSHVLSALVPGFNEQLGVVWAGARLGWFCNSWRLIVCLQMNGTPGLHSLCRGKSYNHIPHILPFPSIWRFN